MSNYSDYAIIIGYKNHGEKKWKQYKIIFFHVVYVCIKNLYQVCDWKTWPQIVP